MGTITTLSFPALAGFEMMTSSGKGLYPHPCSCGSWHIKSFWKQKIKCGGNDALLVVGRVASPRWKQGFSRAALWTYQCTTTLVLEKAATLKRRTESDLCPWFPLFPWSDNEELGQRCTPCLGNHSHCLLWGTWSLSLWMLFHKTDSLPSLYDTY